MKSLFYIIFALTFLPSFVLNAQTIELSFTGKYDTLHIPIDSIVVENLSQGGDTTLYYPDTTLTMDVTTGIVNNLFGSQDFNISQNYPNPFTFNTFIDINVPEHGQISFVVYDICGRELLEYSDEVSAGIHKFEIVPSKKGFLVLSVSFKNKSYSLKIFSNGGSHTSVSNIRLVDLDQNVSNVKSIKSKSGFKFSAGDQLKSIGYCQLTSDTNLLSPNQNTIITLTFNSSKICPPSFVDNRDNNVYTGILIGSQCWMSNNLAYLPSVSPSDSGSADIANFYVYDYQGTNISDAKATNNYNTYGVLYNWPAVMNGSISNDSVPSGIQGICPNGWHIPSNEEWKILEGEIDSQYSYPDTEWDGIGWRGFDAGGNMKEIGLSNWIAPNTGATNSSGFTALPAGNRVYGGSFQGIGYHTYFWTSYESSNTYAWYRRLYYENSDISMFNYEKNYGFSCRCLMD